MTDIGGMEMMSATTKKTSTSTIMVLYFFFFLIAQAEKIEKCPGQFLHKKSIGQISPKKISATDIYIGPLLAQVGDIDRICRHLYIIIFMGLDVIV